MKVFQFPQYVLYVFLLIGDSKETDEECFHEDNIKLDVTDKSSILITTYMTDKNVITINAAFENKNDGIDMDVITINRTSYEIMKIRKSKEDYIISGKLSLPIPIGWSNMNLTVNRHGMYINPYMDKIVADYPMRQIVIGSENMISCHKGTPSWKITRDQPITVPLNGLSRSKISIHSTKDFSSVFNILGNNYYFNSTNQSGVILGTSVSKLPANNYSFILENDNDNIRLTYMNNECGTEIASLKLQTVLTNITAITLDEDFVLTLEPRIIPLRRCELLEPTGNLVKDIYEGKDHSTQIFGIVGWMISIIMLTIVLIRSKDYVKSLLHKAYQATGADSGTLQSDPTNATMLPQDQTQLQPLTETKVTMQRVKMRPDLHVHHLNHQDKPPSPCIS